MEVPVPVVLVVAAREVVVLAVKEEVDMVEVEVVEVPVQIVRTLEVVEVQQIVRVSLEMAVMH